MNTNDTIVTKSENANNGRRRWRGLAIAGIVAALIGVTTIGTMSYAGPGGWSGWGCGMQDTQRGQGMGPGMGTGKGSGMGRGMGRHMGQGMGMGPGMGGQRIERLLSELDATTEQREQVKDIIGKAFEEMHAIHQAKQADRERFIAALSQPEVDRAELERLRQGHLQTAEHVSKRMVQAFADAAAVLSPEQRAKLSELGAGFGPGHYGRRGF